MNTSVAKQTFYYGLNNFSTVFTKAVLLQFNKTSECRLNLLVLQFDPTFMHTNDGLSYPY